ncbi:MAG: ABC transporter permease subunit [Spirochaetales bacterium]|nr:ABC transporter permease subunit [Spirochaetales bacterium]
MGLRNIELRKLEEIIFKILMIVATVIITGSLAFIIVIIIVKGLPAMKLSMITQLPKGGFYIGKEGGILNAIAGSLMVAGGATLLSIIISIPVVLYINIYRKKRSRLANLTRFSFDVLWGVPSIVYGAFGFTVMLAFGIKASLLGGIIAIGFLELPIMSRAVDEVVRMVPSELKEATYSLGATKLETSYKVIVRQTFSGIVTATLIAFGRGIGDAAAVIFTAGYSDYIPDSLSQPAATLPLAIFFQMGTPFPEVQERAYASAFILTLIILVISITSRIIAVKITKHTIK